MLKKQDLELSLEAKEALEKEFAKLNAMEGRANGNGRAVRNIVEKATRAQAVRLSKSTSSTIRSQTREMRLLEAADFAGS